MLEADALALVTLGTGPGADLVMLVGVGAAGDEPAAAAQVGGEDLIAVKLEDTEPTERVIG